MVAATELLLERGYDGTSLTDVATRAQVARPTVIAACGSKPELLSRVLDEALSGDDAPVPVRDRPWFQPVWEAITAHETLIAYARVCVTIAARAGGVVEVVRRATDSAPEVAELWEGWLRGRRAGAAMVVDRAVVTEALRPGLTGATAADVLWTLNDPDLYESLVGRSGWRPGDYESWLADTMIALLLDPSPSGPATGTLSRPGQ